MILYVCFYYISMNNYLQISMNYGLGIQSIYFSRFEPCNLCLNHPCSKEGHLHFPFISRNPFEGENSWISENAKQENFLKFYLVSKTSWCKLIITPEHYIWSKHRVVVKFIWKHILHEFALLSHYFIVSFLLILLVE